MVYFLLLIDVAISKHNLFPSNNINSMTNIGGEQVITGRCECGKVQYEVDDEITDFSHCHCSQCRRLHGAAFASFGGVKRSKFKYITGETDLRSYASSETSDRLFCGNCGSNILVEVESEPDELYLSMGTVDGDPKCPPGYHAFVGSKAPWYEICDDLPAYDTLPDD